jgi:hypothetical protein
MSWKNPLALDILSRKKVFLNCGSESFDGVDETDEDLTCPILVSEDVRCGGNIVRFVPTQKLSHEVFFLLLI